MSAPDSTAPTVVVLGASGRLGQAATAAFAAAGWRVIAQARSALTPAPGVTHVQAPPSALAELERAGRGAVAVVHAVSPPYSRWQREALPVARHAMELATRIDARLLFPGNVYNFGADMPQVLREDTPQRPTTSYGRVRCAIEDELATRPRLRCAVVRAGDFFGAGSGNWFDRVLARRVQDGVLVYPGPLDRAHAWAYLPDLARVLVALAGRQDLPAFSRWHFEGTAATGAEWLDAAESAARELGLVAPGALMARRGFPWPAVHALGLVVPSWRALSQLSYLWRAPHRLDGAALRERLGEVEITPLRRALVAAIGELPMVRARLATRTAAS